MRREGNGREVDAAAQGEEGVLDRWWRGGVGGRGGGDLAVGEGAAGVEVVG